LRRGCGGCPGGAYIGPGGEGERLPATMAINGHSALIVIKRGVKEGETAGLKRGSEGRASLRLERGGGV
jgi:hypothetical protein